MGEILRLWGLSFRNIMLGSGLNGWLAYFNLSRVTPEALTNIQLGQAVLGVCCAIMALVIGVFQIRLTLKRTRLIDKKLKEDKNG